MTDRRQTNWIALTVFVWIAAAAQCARAGDIVIEGLSPGRHYLRINIDASGNATYARIPTARPAGDTDHNAPVDPTSCPTQPSKLASRVSQCVNQVTGDNDRGATALALAVVYAEVAKHWREGAIDNTEEAFEAIRPATDFLLVQRGAKEAWQPVRDCISQELTNLLRSGEEVTEATLRQIADGLRRASGKVEGEAIDLELILQIIRLILDLLANK